MIETATLHQVIVLTGFDDNSGLNIRCGFLLPSGCENAITQAVAKESSYPDQLDCIDFFQLKLNDYYLHQTPYVVFGKIEAYPDMVLQAYSFHQGKEMCKVQFYHDGSKEVEFGKHYDGQSALDYGEAPTEIPKLIKPFLAKAAYI